MIILVNATNLKLSLIIKVMEIIYFTPITILVGFVLYIIYQFFIRIYIDGQRFKRMDPDLKVFIAPFSGLIGLQRQCVKKYGDSHYFIKQMIKEDPDLKAYLTNLGNRPFLILTDPKLIKQVTLNPKKFRKLNLMKHIDKAYSRGIFFVQDDDWKAERGIISHAFSHQHLKRMIPIMTQSTNSFIDRLKIEINNNTQKKRVFKVMHETQLLIGEILLKTFFSQNAMRLQAAGRPLTEALADFSTQMFDRARSGVNLLTSLLFGERARRINFSKNDKKLQDLVDGIRKTLFQIVDQRIEKHQEEQIRDFLHHYIKQMKQIDGQIEQALKAGKQHKLRRITKQQIMQQLISFYFAGIDTTGHLLAFAFYALGEYPNHRERIIQELNQTIPTMKDINYQNLQKLEFMGKFLDEALRMWPPATGPLARQTRQDIKIGPYNVPKNTAIGINIIGNMHNPKYYTEPHVFNPDRWQPKAIHTQEPYSFIPFSAGNRSCIGKYLALMESKIIITMFLRNFTLTRTQEPLRLCAKFLYQPLDDRLLSLQIGGSPFKQVKADDAMQRQEQ